MQPEYFYTVELPPEAGLLLERMAADRGSDPEALAAVILAGALRHMRDAVDDDEAEPDGLARAETERPGTSGSLDLDDDIPF